MEQCQLDKVTFHLFRAVASTQVFSPQEGGQAHADPGMHPWQASVGDRAECSPVGQEAEGLLLLVQIWASSHLSGLFPVCNTRLHQLIFLWIQAG